MKEGPVNLNAKAGPLGRAQTAGLDKCRVRLQQAAEDSALTGDPEEHAQLMRPGAAPTLECSSAWTIEVTLAHAGM